MRRPKNTSPVNDRINAAANSQSLRLPDGNTRIKKKQIAAQENSIIKVVIEIPSLVNLPALFISYSCLAPKVSVDLIPPFPGVYKLLFKTGKHGIVHFWGQ